MNKEKRFNDRRNVSERSILLNTEAHEWRTVGVKECGWGGGGGGGGGGEGWVVEGI